MSLLKWKEFAKSKTELGNKIKYVNDLIKRHTPVLQPLDKCINKPFKNKVRSQYQAWIVNGPFTYTPSGKKRAPSKELVLQWIHKA